MNKITDQVTDHIEVEIRSHLWNQLRKQVYRDIKSRIYKQLCTGEVEKLHRQVKVEIQINSKINT